jgi:hypothetical protein
MTARTRRHAIAVATATLWLPAAVVPARPDDGGAPRVRIEAVARAGGWDLPQGDPWSPSGSRLALVAHERLAIWDASRPDDAPRPVLDARVVEVRWSPDGSWLCCRVRVANATRGGAVRLQFVAADGGVPEYRIPNAAIGPWVWADDGFVYFWSGQTGERRRVEPPRAWRERAVAAPDEPRPQIVQAASGSRSRKPRTLLFTPGAAGREPRETPLDSLVAPAGAQPWCGFLDPGSGAPRWIVTFHGRGGEARTCVVDALGRRRECLTHTDSRPFDDVSVSADGRWVLGTSCTRPRDGTVPRCDTRLLSTAGEWSQPLPGIDGTRAQFDRSSALVAVAVREPRGVRIVRLHVDPSP